MRSPLAERPQDHGSGSEQLVSGDRPQSAKVRREYFQGQRRGLRQGDAARVSIKGFSFASASDDGEVRNQVTNSSARNACARVTVGKLSKNSSSVRPASQLLIRASTGTRVP